MPTSSDTRPRRQQSALVQQLPGLEAKYQSVGASITSSFTGTVAGTSAAFSTIESTFSVS